ncbi:unnamed protein product [Amoebophrya sp. A25]|nr:unnamed protein product [Amoebophrya sp. A25]|eukprot:GSA25T00018981001.1
MSIVVVILFFRRGYLAKFDRQPYEYQRVAVGIRLFYSRERSPPRMLPAILSYLS